MKNRTGMYLLIRYFLLTGIIFFVHQTLIAQTSTIFSYSEGLAGNRIAGKGNRSIYGFVDQKGKIEIPHQYDTIYTSFKNGFAGVGKDKKAGVIDKKGKLIVPFEYKEVGEIQKNIIPVKSVNGLWGFFDEYGVKFYEPAFQNYRFGGKNKIMVQRDGKWGMINSSGEVLLDFKYKWIQSVSDKNYRLFHVNEWSVRDATNKVLFTMSYDSLRSVGEGYYKYYMIGKYGFADAKGNKVTDTEFDEIGVFHNNLVVVKKNKVGVMDKTQKMVIPYQYDAIYLDSLYIRVKVLETTPKGEVKEKWGLFDYKGNKLIAPKYSRLSVWSNGLIAAMKEDGSWGYIDSKGNTEIIFRYSYAEDFNKGMAKVKVPYLSTREEHFALIDKSGEYVVAPADYENYLKGIVKIGANNKAFYIASRTAYDSYERVSENFMRVQKKGKYGMLTGYGVEVVPVIYDYVSVPSNKGYMVVEKDGKSGIVDGSGKFTFRLSNRFEKIYGFQGNFSKFLSKGKYGFIDMRGDVYISPQYLETGDMSDSMVNVKLRGKWGFVDYKENLKVQPYYQEVKPFKNGIALVSEHGRWNIINKEGKELHQIPFDKIVETLKGNYILKAGDKVGLADKRGKEVLAPKYEQIIEAGKNYLLVKRNGLWGVLDYKENFVLPIEFDVVIYEASANIFITGKSGKQEDVLLK